MREVVVSEFVSLDGVIEEPAWTFRFESEDRDAFKFDELAAADALLLGRVTYEGFAAAWPGMEEETGEYGTWMNGYPKHLVSATLEEPLEWRNSALIKGDLAGEVAALKDQPGKDILVFGSADLVNTLTRLDLVDEYRIMVFSVVVGRGQAPLRGGPRHEEPEARGLEGLRVRRRRAHLHAGRGGRIAGHTRDDPPGGTMPRQMTEEERQEFLAGFHVAVLSVSRGARPPHATPVWYAYEPGGNVTFFTGTQGRKSRKAVLAREAGALSLTVQQEEFPYRYVTVEGTVVGVDRPPSEEQALAVARRYLPEEQARGFVEAELGNPTPEFVLFTVRPDRWLTFDFADEAG